MGKASRKKRPVKAKARKSSLGFTIVVVRIVVLGVAGIALSRGGGERRRRRARRQDRRPLARHARA